MNNTYDAPTRYEMNRLVRRVLTRHRTDLGLITISCTARFVHLSGRLTKTTRPDYKPADIDLIFQEIKQVPMVRGIEADLENWTVNASNSTETWFVTPKRPVLQHTAGRSETPVHKIEEVEKIIDVLDDIKKQKPVNPGGCSVRSDAAFVSVRQASRLNQERRRQCLEGTEL